MIRVTLCWLSIIAALSQAAVAGGTLQFEGAHQYSFYNWPDPDSNYVFPFYAYNIGSSMCDLLIPHDPGAVIGFSLDTGWTQWEDRIGPFVRTDAHEYLANAIRTYKVRDTLRTYLFQFELMNKTLEVWDITNKEFAGTPTSPEPHTSYFFAGSLTWCKQMWVYANTIYLASDRGVHALTFDAANNVLRHENLFAQSGGPCFAVYRYGGTIYVLRGTAGSATLLWESYDYRDLDSPMFAIESDTIGSVGVVQIGGVVVIDNFLQDGVSVIDTIAFASFPSRDRKNLVLWVVDPDPGAANAEVTNYQFYSVPAGLPGGGSCKPHDVKYADGHVIVMSLLAWGSTYDPFTRTRLSILRVDSLAAAGVSVADSFTTDDPSLRQAQIAFELQTIPISEGGVTLLYSLACYTRLPDVEPLLKIYRHTFLAESSPTSYSVGDWNDDGWRNISDAVGILAHCASYCGTDSAGVAAPLARGDVNGDGFVNDADAARIVFYIFGADATEVFHQDCFGD